MPLGLLDLYVLSLIDRGVDTPYALQRDGGLSLGASTPALRRLNTARLVKRKEDEGATNRPRHVYALTAAGRELARRGWQEHLHNSRLPSDLDGVLRLVAMASHYGANPTEIADFLQQASENRTSSAKQAAAIITRAGQPISYKDMRSRCDAARLQAEAGVLAYLAEEVANRRRSKLTAGVKPSAALKRSQRDIKSK
jgi:DNA-binding PadR family transcriptional regulator